MKTQLLSQIKAKVGRCHLHSKKKSSYSITLKMGSKAVVSTQYKTPKNQQINFDCELLMQVDRHILEGPGKLSIIVNMLTEEKQKKVVGSVFANLKQSGMQNYKVSQCSCKDKAFQVEIGFQVVNIQNLNNNHNNNKFLSPNQSEMKDLKSTLTVSRQKQMVKNIKNKKLTAAKSPIQKTQAKVRASRNQKQFETQISMSPNHSQLTKVISSKQNEQNKQIICNLKDQIKKLQNKLKLSREELIQKQKYLNSLSNQFNNLQKTSQQVRSQNICLLELLKLQEEKYSAAVQYINFISNYLKRAISQKNNQNTYMNLIRQISQNSLNNDFCLKQLQASKRQSRQFSFGNRQIQEKQEYQQINANLTQQLELYKFDNINLKKEIQYLVINKQIKNSQFQQQKKKTKKVQQQRIKLESILKQITVQFENLKKCNQKILKDSQKFKSNISQLQNQKFQLQSFKNLLQKEIVGLKQVNSQKEKDIASKNLELQETNSKLKNLQKSNQNLKNLLQQKQKQIFQLNQQLKMQKCLVQNLRKKESVRKEKNINEDKTQIQQNIRQIQMLIPDYSNNVMSNSRKTVFEGDNEFQQNKSLLSQLQQVSQIKPDENYDIQSQKKLKILKQRSTQAQISQADDASGAIVQKYNYNYDIDSVNYFNNFNDNHVDIQDSLVDNGELDEVSPKLK